MGLAKKKNWKYRCSSCGKESHFTLSKNKAINKAYDHIREPGTHQVDVWQEDETINIIISKFAASDAE